MAQLIATRAQGKFPLDRPHPSILIVAAKWWPSSARLAVALQRHGCQVSAICPAGHPLTHVSGIRRIYRYGGIFSLANLRGAVLDCQPDLVIPCDDGVVAQLHALYELDPSLTSLIDTSLGAPESYSVVSSRYDFLNTAIELGIRVPRTQKVTSTEDLEHWHDTVGPLAVVKVDGESGGNGVRVCRTFDESLTAWQELHRPPGRATAWKRFAIDRDPLSLWSRRQSSERQLTVQAFVPGRPANSMLVCWRGELLSLISVLVVAAEGSTGAATVVRVIQNERMKKAAELVVSRLKLSGFYGLDFIMESGTGVPYLIEMNPRCTQLGHIELPGKGSLAGVLSAVLRGEQKPSAQNPIRSDTIALFPQALAAGDACRSYIESSHHDMPLEEPHLMSELLLKSWPQRRWAARVYHTFKPLQRVAPIVFEGRASGTIAAVR